MAILRVLSTQVRDDLAFRLPNQRKTQRDGCKPILMGGRFYGNGEVIALLGCELNAKQQCHAAITLAMHATDPKQGSQSLSQGLHV